MEGEQGEQQAELRRGLDLRLAVRGDHFMQFLLGGGDGTVPVMQCRDCGLQIGVDATVRAAWVKWVRWCMSAPVELVELAQERSHCGE